MQLTRPTAVCHNALPVASASRPNFDFPRRHRVHIGSLDRFPTVNINNEFGPWSPVDPLPMAAVVVQNEKHSATI
jgi:hypothetical protein